MRAGLIGDGIGPSLTPGMHEAEGRALGLDYRYDRFDTARGQHAGRALAELLDEAEAAGFAGLNITHPHKRAVVPLLHRLEGVAGMLGTVNTVLFRAGTRIGCNTDHAGFRHALADRIGDIAGQHVLLAGPGGAGLAVALAVLDAGAALSLIDRGEAPAEAAAGRLRAVRPGLRVAALRHLPDGLRDFDGAINCTPLGMAGHPGMAFDPAGLAPAAWVADIVYSPLRTRLIRTAQAQGRTVMDGGAMALYQAVESFGLITGHAPDTGRMAARFGALLKQRETREPAA